MAAVQDTIDATVNDAFQRAGAEHSRVPSRAESIECGPEIAEARRKEVPPGWGSAFRARSNGTPMGAQAPA
jgi:hypothetical protein